MGWSVDARVPVRFGSVADAAEGDAVLIEGDAPAPGCPVVRFGTTDHPAGCACCVPRSGAAQALSALFLARAKGETPFFRRVLAVAGPNGEAAVRAALQADAMVAGCFRLA